MFASYGRLVARYPLIMISCCFVTTGLALIGMIRYRTENNAFKLWIPDNSDFVANFAWLEENSPPDIRFNSVILAAEENILTPTALLHMVRLHSKVESLRTSPSVLSWEEVCYDIPVISLSASRSDNSSQCDPSLTPPLAGALLPQCLVPHHLTAHHHRLPGAESPGDLGIQRGGLPPAITGGHHCQSQ